MSPLPNESGSFTCLPALSVWQGKNFKKEVLRTLVLQMILLPLVVTAEEECSRLDSRVARKLITQELEPAFKKHGLSMPRSCPFHADFDIYALVESHKEEETTSRWVCGLCGKTFFEERFLDNHFENRHTEFIRRGSGVVCLAEFCDIFRCDVISGKKKPQYWDMALCREKDLHRLQDKCQATVERCVPNDASKTVKLKLKEQMNTTFCDYLTCDKYWELPEEEMNPINLALYIILSVVLVFGLVVYYYVAYTHFFTNESLWNSQTHFEEEIVPTRGPYAPLDRDMRYRGFSGQAALS